MPGPEHRYHLSVHMPGAMGGQGNQRDHEKSVHINDTRAWYLLWDEEVAGGGEQGMSGWVDELGVL